MITTGFDFMFERIKDKKELYVHDLIRFMKKKHEIEKEDAERYLNVLTEMGVVEILYSKSLFGRDRAILLNPHLEESLRVDVSINENEKILDEYTITLDDSRVDVKILSSKGEAGPVYTIFPADIGEGTQWFFEYVTKQIPGLLNIVQEEEAVSIRMSDTARKQLIMKVGEIIERTIPKEDLNKKIFCHIHGLAS